MSGYSYLAYFMYEEGLSDREKYEDVSNLPSDVPIFHL